ncbi:MAG: CheY-like chemotaxis protein, partial [Bradymonadia bacterium]
MSSILLVDDDFALVEALSRELEQLNHTAILTQTADEAIEVLGQMPIDVMVTDLRMRGRDGIELLRRCVEISPSTRTVLMSAYATATDYKQARALGAVEVLSKPFTPTEFAAAIRRAEDFKAGFQADIVGLSLVDLLKVFHHSGRSVTLRVGRVGKVHLREGQIIHAETDTKVGADALLALLKVERGVLATGTIEPVAQTLTMPFETLLLGTLAHIDEQRSRRPPRIDTKAIIKALTSSPP